MFTLFLALAYVGFIILAMTFGLGAMAMLSGGASAAGGALGGGLIVFFGLFALFVLALIIPSIAVAVRRLHDTDRSGWWFAAPIALSALGAAFRGGALETVLGLASGVASITLLVFYCLDGTRGPNRFGPDPKDPAGEHLAEVFR
jgi:uncharacterized membrane protein YhaH (DUF805 family)